MTKAVSLLKQYMQYIKHTQGFEKKIMDKVKIVFAGDGVCKAEFILENDNANVFGQLHGGCSASLIDITSAIALLSHKNEAGGVSVNMNLSYLKAANLGDQIEIIAKTVRRGKTMGFIEVEIKCKETGYTLVTGTHTKYLA